jgi:hypothetical protein
VGLAKPSAVLPKPEKLWAERLKGKKTNKNKILTFTGENL